MKSSYSDGFFSIDSQNGFLPVKDPLDSLPEKYETLQTIINKLPNLMTLQNIKFETLSMLVHERLIDYTELIKEESDMFILQALYRAYAFLSSAYLLEPSYLHFKNTGEYGQGREILPKVIAVPFCYIANRLGVQPWLDYHYAYGLGNYVKVDKSKGLNWNNLKMACRFTNSDDETGFIMLHVFINELSKDLVKSVQDAIEAMKENDESALTRALELNFNTIKEMNKRKREMWIASNYTKYNDFRIFIMGSKGNTQIFPRGVTYEGVSEDPMVYRGQTGAQDDVIPTEDIFTGINNYYEDNELTKFLQDLRQYRPHCVREYIHDLQETMKEHNLFNHLVNLNNKLPLIYLLGIVAEVYKFRFRHFNFVKKYIMENTKYPVATGGTPVQTWLPNQMKAVMIFYTDIKNKIPSSLTSLESNLLETIDKDITEMELF